MVKQFACTVLRDEPLSGLLSVIIFVRFGYIMFRNHLSEEVSILFRTGLFKGSRIETQDISNTFHALT